VVGGVDVRAVGVERGEGGEGVGDEFPGEGVSGQVPGVEGEC
jgi:hypothetical protein